MKVLVLDFFNLVKRYLYTSKLTDLEDSELIDIVTTNILNKINVLVHNFSPDFVYICSDNGNNRRAMAITGGNYKANRKRNKSLTEEEKEKNYTEYLKSVFETLPIPFIDIRDTEADMVIYCLTNYLIKLDNSIEIVIASSDSDFIQLLSDNVKIYDWYKEDIDKDNWYEKYDKNGGLYLSPGNYAIAKSIVGDTADNIAGIKNVGWKKVLKLFNILYSCYGQKYIEKFDLTATDLILLLDDYVSDIDNKELEFVNKMLQLIKINKELIDKNQSIIELSNIETPFIYNIMETIKRKTFDDTINFDRKEFMRLLHFERYKDNDENVEYKKIVAKNMKASMTFYTLAKKMSNSAKILKNRMNNK